MNLANEFERYVLVTLFQSTNGNAWSSRRGWLQSEDITKWEGIEINDGQLISIGLGSNNLVGKFTSPLFDFKTVLML